MAKDQDILVSEHAYDGIQEYDNPLPMWWLVTFFVTIIFGALYWMHYEFGGGWTQDQELNADLARVEALQQKSGGSGESESELMALLGKDDVLATGKVVYDSKCAVCHGPQLQGSIGPNLVDDHWINGQGKITEIAHVVRKGVLDKGMPNWDTMLKKAEVQAVSAYIYAQYGTNPPNAKAPQGAKVAR